jgi:lipopolysaccharide export LptBFGC system permease protein LptF
MVLVVANLQQTKEMVALSAGGVRAWRILRPIVGGGLVLALVAVLLLEYATPALHAHIRRHWLTHSEAMLSDLLEQVGHIRDAERGYVILTNGFRDGHLKATVVLQCRADGDLALVAGKGTLKLAPDGKRLLLDLYAGWFKKTGDERAIPFTRHELDLPWSGLGEDAGGLAEVGLLACCRRLLHGAPQHGVLRSVGPALAFREAAAQKTARAVVEELLGREQQLAAHELHRRLGLILAALAMLLLSPCLLLLEGKRWFLPGFMCLFLVVLLVYGGLIGFVRLLTNDVGLAPLGWQCLPECGLLVLAAVGMWWLRDK